MRDPPASGFSFSSLLCEEDATFLQEGVGEEINHATPYTEEDDEYVRTLIEREKNVGFNSSRHSSEEWIKCARIDEIKWMVDRSASFGFGFQTLFLSVTYFDRFLSCKSETWWINRLLSAACLSLAAKMEESNVPRLSEYKVGERSEVIRSMEIMVLNTLDWRMGLVTPYAYVNYFITKFCKSHPPPRNIESRTRDLIMAITRDVSLMDQRPSSVAGAATLVALDQNLTRQTLDSRIDAMSPFGLLEIDDVFYYCKLMQEVDLEKIENVKTALVQEIVLENSSVTRDGVGNKRRRLTFDD